MAHNNADNTLPSGIPFCVLMISGAPLSVMTEKAKDSHTFDKASSSLVWTLLFFASLLLSIALIMPGNAFLYQ